MQNINRIFFLSLKAIISTLNPLLLRHLNRTGDPDELNLPSEFIDGKNFLFFQRQICDKNN